MKKTAQLIFMACFALLFTAIPCMAEEIEPPFTWEGKGQGTFIGENGINEMEFGFELSVDEYGMVKGEVTSDQGNSTFKHVFCSDKKEYEWPGFFTRKIVIVMLMDESAGSMYSVIDGRIIGDKFLYGEVFVAQLEQDSDAAKALGIGNDEMTLLDSEELPRSLRTAIKDKCLPFGTVNIQGDYKKEPVAKNLFNGWSLDGWHIYLKESDANPKKVFKVKDGAILCTGDPFGYIRTTEKYDDFKLSLEWKWPGKAGNSGVLLRINGEDKIWPLCMEAQLKSTRAGDFVGMGCEYNEYKGKKDSFFKVVPRKNETNEKAPGGWNTYEILCKGGTIELKVNGLLQNKATGVKLEKGYIGLQSEGAPIMFRNIKLTPLQ